jgi:hypothetical protein
LSQREVEIVFRVAPTTARSILTTMLATYEEALREKFLDRMRADATVLKTGTDDTGLTWTLRFTEPSTFDAARAELGRLGFGADVESNTAQRTLTVPRSIRRGSKSKDPLGELGLKAPS